MFNVCHNGFSSAQVTDDNNAESGSAGVYKKLFGNCPELEAITKHVGHVRNHIHYKLTMPWSDLGQRLLATAMLPDYQLLMSEAEVEFWRLVKEFMKVYQWEVSQAGVRYTVPRTIPPRMRYVRSSRSG